MWETPRFNLSRAGEESAVAPALTAQDRDFERSALCAVRSYTPVESERLWPANQFADGQECQPLTCAYESGFKPRPRSGRPVHSLACFVVSDKCHFNFAIVVRSGADRVQPSRVNDQVHFVAVSGARACRCRRPRRIYRWLRFQGATCAWKSICVEAGSSRAKSGGSDRSWLASMTYPHSSRGDTRASPFLP